MTTILAGYLSDTLGGAWLQRGCNGKKGFGFSHISGGFTCNWYYTNKLGYPVNTFFLIICFFNKTSIGGCRPTFFQPLHSFDPLLFELTFLVCTYLILTCYETKYNPSWESESVSLVSITYILKLFFALESAQLAVPWTICIFGGRVWELQPMFKARTVFLLVKISTLLSLNLQS